uniref:SPNS lysolipid transporter 3, sphingosine-1-phosphate (putative) n=1 Tax=Mastacembelus armatus TaxID=205130 RepID=A0A7N8WPN4_9TELE
MEPKGSVSSLQDVTTHRWSVGSNLGLPYGSFANSLASLTPNAGEKQVISPKRAYVAVAVLCYINLVNYMERYTIAGVLTNIQTFFAISDDSTAGLLQTVFICSFLLLAPAFGYLGDRYNRKYIMIAGISVWLLTALSSSFVTQSYFWLLVLLRGLVGVGEASYSTIAPTIIGDLFVGGKRSIVICVFYIFIPVGSGLGYIIGGGSATLTGDWRWALRVGTFSLFIMCGLTFDLYHLYLPNFHQNCSKVLILPVCLCSLFSFIFGAVTVATGIMGGGLGTGLSRWFRDKVPNADPLICAVGMLGAVPCLFITIFVASASIPATYVFIFLGELLLSLNWAVMADMLLYIVIPTRRSTAEALQITVGHLLGDAGSPYLLGAISNAIYKSKPGNDDWRFRSLKYSLVICPFVGLLGGLFFFLTSRYIIEDRKAAQQLIEGTGNRQLH